MLQKFTGDMVSRVRIVRGYPSRGVFHPMSLSHLKELRTALSDHGWQVSAERLRGEDDVQGAATWEVRRNEESAPVLIDFAGFGPIGEEISLEESYACSVRGRSNSGLYFRRVNRSRELWLRDLAAFVASLNAASDG